MLLRRFENSDYFFQPLLRHVRYQKNTTEILRCNLNILESTNRNWFLGDRGKTCDDTCSKIGRVCNAAKQSMLTTNKLVQEKMQEAGYTCKGFHGSRSYAGTPFSTGRKNDDCAPISKIGKLVCNANKYGNKHGHRALCYCEGLKI